MIESILGFGADPNPRTPENCSCGAGCSSGSYIYFMGYSDGVFSQNNHR